MAINPYTGLYEPDRRADGTTPLQQILQGNPSATPGVLDYSTWLARYGNANGTTRPSIPNEQILAENPGLTQELLDLYSTRMRGDYAAQNPQFQFAPGTFDLRSMPSWNTVQQQGFDPQKLIYGNGTIPATPAIPGGQGQRATPAIPAVPGNVQAGSIRATGPTNTLNNLLNNRGTGYLGKTYPENRPWQNGTMLDQVLRRQSGYVR